MQVTERLPAPCRVLLTGRTNPNLNGGPLEVEKGPSTSLCRPQTLWKCSEPGHRQHTVPHNHARWGLLVPFSVITRIVIAPADHVLLDNALGRPWPLRSAG